MTSSFIDKVRQVLRESLPLSQGVEYSKNWDRSRYTKVFGDKYRIYLPLDHIKNITQQPDIAKIRIPKIIQTDFTAAVGRPLYAFEYVRGTVGSSHQVALSRVLQEIDPDGYLLDIYNADKQRQGYKLTGKDFLLVISRHPYDIAGMSTNRNWRSCMEIPNKENPAGGVAHPYVKQDICHGTLIAYLIRKNDKDIHAPLGRVLIKPYVDAGGENDSFILRVSENVYGSMPDEIRDEVVEWVNRNQHLLSGTDDQSTRSYITHPNLYHDWGDPKRVVGARQDKGTSSDDWERYL